MREGATIQKKNVWGNFNLNSGTVVKSHVIDVPRKKNLKRIISQFEPETVYDDVDEGVFIFKQYGRAIFRSKPWEPGVRTDVIHFNKKQDIRLLNNLKIRKSAPEPAKKMITDLIIAYWDCFVEEGIKRPILGFEFAIDTGKHTPVCCKKPRYGPHETKIIMKQVKVLLANKLISKCTKGGWGSPVVLAPKPHQEHINEVEELIWRMCISYRGLNRVTNPFEYPIGRCDDSIEDVGDGTQYVYFISVDSAQGYHQIRVQACDKDKLAFFAPDN